MYVRLHTFLLEIAVIPEGLNWCSRLVLLQPASYRCSPMTKQGTDAVAESPYVRAMPLSQLKDLDLIERVLSGGNVLIIKITPIAKRSVEETKVAINQLTDFAKRQGGDIARLGEERVVLTPPGIRIWREKAKVHCS
jgi:SepF-like predicted cell division protein (DUF552 family)